MWGIRQFQFGSAPRVRGTGVESGSVDFGDRFSPAGAGNRRLSCLSLDQTAVQPRGCGELASVWGIRQFQFGSAPRVRGTELTSIKEGLPLRFSPACAGNSLTCTKVQHDGAVQPRVCGEQVLVYAHVADHAGSAPRVRGTDVERKFGSHMVRFSPACAGNSCRPGFYPFSNPVQPRVCGEQ